MMSFPLLLELTAFNCLSPWLPITVLKIVQPSLGSPLTIIALPSIGMFIYPDVANQRTHARL